MENPYKYTDEEPNLMLRKCRNLLGYGLGWTFRDAFVDWIVPKLIMLALASAWLFLSLHLEISVRIK